MPLIFDLDSLNQTGFTWQTALSLALASDLVYQRAQAVENVATLNWHLDGCKFLEHANTACFVAHTHSAILISFRGTQSLSDWLTNLDVWSTSTSYGKVHGGFRKAFESVAPELINTIKSLGPHGKLIQMTGHSLGGALATIAAAELQGQFSIAGIYTFGQPRIGDGRTVDFFQTYYARAFHRFVFDNDIVTRIPPGYQHVGKLYHFDANGFLLPPVAEATGLSSEPPELTKEEFEQLQRTARTIRDEAKAATLGAPEASAELADRSLEGIFPSVSDHRMSRYL